MDAENYLKEVENEIKKILIKQEFLDRKNGKPKCIQIKQTDLLKTAIKLVNLIRKNFTK